MSTIAFDGRWLAADSQITFGTRAQYTPSKLHRHGDAFIGVVGASSTGAHLLHWYKSGADPAQFPARAYEEDCAATLLVVEKGRVQMFMGPHGADVMPPVAAGSGSDIAVAAMLMGKSAADAVELAKQLDIYTGGPLHYMDTSVS